MSERPILPEHTLQHGRAYRIPKGAQLAGQLKTILEDVADIPSSDPDTWQWFDGNKIPPSATLVLESTAQGWTFMVTWDDREEDDYRAAFDAAQEERGRRKAARVEQIPAPAPADGWEALHSVAEALPVGTPTALE